MPRVDGLATQNKKASRKNGKRVAGPGRGDDGLLLENALQALSDLTRVDAAREMVWQLGIGRYVDILAQEENPACAGASALLLSHLLWTERGKAALAEGFGPRVLASSQRWLLWAREGPYQIPVLHPGCILQSSDDFVETEVAERVLILLSMLATVS